MLLTFVKSLPQRKRKRHSKLQKYKMRVISDQGSQGSLDEKIMKKSRCLPDIKVSAEHEHEKPVRRSNRYKACGLFNLLR